MKIAIISDIHENFHNLILALQSIEEQNCEYILCLGDLMNTGIASVLASQTLPVFMIWGNNDGEKIEIMNVVHREASQLAVSLTVYDFITIDDKKIFLSHYENLAEPMALSGLYDAVFFGHSHLSSNQKINDCHVCNPGELAAAKTGKATFAIYDTIHDHVELITLEKSVSLRTNLVSNYFEKHKDLLNFRSKALQ